MRLRKHGAEFAEYDGDGRPNNTPLRNIVPDRQSLAHCQAVLNRDLNRMDDLIQILQDSN